MGVTGYEPFDGVGDAGVWAAGAAAGVDGGAAVAGVDRQNPVLLKKQDAGAGRDTRHAPTPGRHWRAPRIAKEWVFVNLRGRGNLKNLGAEQDAGTGCDIRHPPPPLGHGGAPRGVHLPSRRGLSRR